MAEKVYKKVQPCGMLYTFGREYFLLNPQPLPKDSWQGDNAYRWVVVPTVIIGNRLSTEPFYSFARHIVSTAFTVDYSPDMPEINIWQLGDIDVANVEWQPQDEEFENNYLDDEVYMEALGADLDD